MGRVLLNKDDFVLKFSSVIFSYYSFVEFCQHTWVPRGISISVHSQTKSKIIFHGSPLLKNFLIFNFPLTHVLMILPYWQLLTPIKFPTGWGIINAIQNECIMQFFLDFDRILLGRAF